nr:CBS domain-containing protein [Arsenicicoccus piscis]
MTRVFVARLAGLSVFDPLGDRVGRVRDVVLAFPATRRRPRVLGLVVEVAGRRRVFVPITRVTNMDAGQVVTTGLVNMRRFEQRPTETLALAEVLDRGVQVQEAGQEAYEATVEDILMEPERGREWAVTKVYVRKGVPSQGGGLRRITGRRGETRLVDVADVTGLHLSASGQGAARLLESYDDSRPADLAEVIHELTPQRRVEVATSLDDDKLADVMEELPADDQIEILASLDVERAADVLEAMEPDDAADLLSELPQDRQEELLQLMEPGEAAPLRRLLTYDDESAGGLMTTEPIILGPEATIAEALATVRQEDVAPALATVVCVCRPPLETPTGRYLGIVHIQRLLREPPHSPVGSILDKELEPLDPEDTLGTVTRVLANYNQVCMPVVDADGHLLGAVSVDDVLDHILPEDWREERHEESDEVIRG